MLLLSDFNGEALRGFGVAREWRGFADVAERAAFLLHGDTVRSAWRYDDGEVPDFDALLEAARGL